MQKVGLSFDFWALCRNAFQF